MSQGKSYKTLISEFKKGCCCGEQVVFLLETLSIMIILPIDVMLAMLFG
jgi:hypothetical protein